MKALLYGCWFFGIIIFLSVTVVYGDGDDDDEDDSDEQDGIYDYLYIQRPCGEQVVSPGHGKWKKYGFIMADSDGCYNPNTDCAIHLNVSSNYQITLRFQNLYSYCGDDILLISDESDFEDFCGYGTPAYSLYSTSSFLKFHFRTGTATQNGECLPGFKLYYTAYHTGECSADEFRCAIDGRCIPLELKCDKYDNCGDWSDEKAGTCGLTTGAIIAICVMSALVGLTAFAFICYCIYVRVNRRKTRCARENATRRGPPTEPNEPIGPPGYTEPPPAYTVVNTVYAGVYEDPIEDEDAPPSYHTVGAVTTENTAT